MGKPVTVDSDDLEVLLAASVGMRKIEEEIKAIANDPVTLRLAARGRIEEAHARVNRARAEAVKDPRDRNPLWGQDPTNNASIKLLKRLWEIGEATTDDVRAWDDLRERGFVVMGNGTLLIKWGDGGQEVHPESRLRVRLTSIGVQWCALQGWGIKSDQES